jgi:hypothetical protein
MRAESLQAEVDEVGRDAEAAWRALADTRGAVPPAQASRLLAWVRRALTPLVPRLRDAGLVEVAVALEGHVAAEGGDARAHLWAVRERLLRAFPEGLPPAPALPAELVSTYEKATYGATPPGWAGAGAGIVFRVGERTPALDGCLARQAASAQVWTLLTAWNPRSRPQSAEANAQAQARLVARLAEAGLPCWPAWGEEGDWREESLLVPGLGPEEARWFGREFEQVAVVCGRPGGVTGLVYCGPRVG